MKTKILEILEKRGNGCSFVELSEIDGFKGDLWFGEGDKNIIYWFNISSEAIGAINDLRKEKRIELVSTSPLVYHIDGQVPTFPIAKQDRKYKKPRWQPCAINKGQKF